ncbi:uncharacterized protein [Anabrus simplex]|uniref:uncharacterized protein n=1 Tax=Anabrus simplex TaxID=316456 RepID=UPI0035A3867A
MADRYVCRSESALRVPTKTCFVTCSMERGFVYGFLALLCAIVWDVHGGYTKLAGPYNLVFNRWEMCPEQGTGGFWFTPRVHKKSKSLFVYNGNASLPYDTDNTTAINVTVAKWGGGGWGMNAYNYYGRNICETFKQMARECFDRFTAAASAPSECPFKKGTYQFKDFELRADKIDRLPELPYGKYRGDIQLLKNNKMFGCIRIFGEVEEKVPEKGGHRFRG